MNLYVMRHGEAESLKTTDQERCLTIQGASQSFRAGQWLSTRFLKGVSSLNVLVSPYVRAQQTLNEVLQSVNAEEIEISNDIIPFSRPNLMASLLPVMIESRKIEHLLLVSHMPFVSLFCTEICAEFGGKIFATGDVLVLNYGQDKQRAHVIDHYRP